MLQINKLIAGLTKDEKKAMRQLGASTDLEFVSQETFDLLVKKGLALLSSPKQVDLTDLGETVCDHLNNTAVEPD
jgi:hypothetical protein